MIIYYYGIRLFSYSIPNGTEIGLLVNFFSSEKRDGSSNANTLTQLQKTITE